MLIKVSPALLEAQSQKLDVQTTEYRAVYSRIYQEAQELRTRWAGETNQAYCTQLEEFRNDFVALENLFRQYAQYLRSTATQYKETEQKLAGEANTKLKLV